MSAIEHPHVDGLFKNPAYSHVAIASGARTIYISGQVAMDSQGNLIGAGDLGAQTEQVMRNLGLALAGAGASFADVVKITTYVVDYEPEHRAIIGKVRLPLLIMHGERDMVIPVEMGRALARLANEPKRLVTFPNAGHMDIYVDGNPGLETVRDWISRLPH